MKIHKIMDKKIAYILKEHIQWKNFCIDSLKNDYFTNSFLDSTKNTMIKIFQRDKFFLELYLSTFESHEVILPSKIR